MSLDAKIILLAILVTLNSYAWGNIIINSTGSNITPTLYYGEIGVNNATRQVQVGFSSGGNGVAVMDNHSTLMTYWRNGGAKIGIGTTSPTSKLHIKGNNFPGVTFEDASDNGTSGGFSIAMLLNRAGVGTVPSVGDRLWVMNGSYADGATNRVLTSIAGYAETGMATGASGRYAGISFLTAGGGAQTERVRIPSTGGIQVRSLSAKPASCTSAQKGTLLNISTATRFYPVMCGKSASGFYHYTTIPITW